MYVNYFHSLQICLFLFFSYKFSCCSSIFGSKFYTSDSSPVSGNFLLSVLFGDTCVTMMLLPKKSSLLRGLSLRRFACFAVDSAVFVGSALASVFSILTFECSSFCSFSGSGFTSSPSDSN